MQDKVIKIARFTMDLTQFVKEVSQVETPFTVWLSCGEMNMLFHTRPINVIPEGTDFKTIQPRPPSPVVLSDPISPDMDFNDIEKRILDLKNAKELELQLTTPRGTILQNRTRRSSSSNIITNAIKLNTTSRAASASKLKTPPSPTSPPPSPLNLKDRLTQRFRRGSVSPTTFIPSSITPRKEYTHVMLMGAFGCGKSTFYKQLVSSIDDCIGSNCLIYAFILENLQRFAGYFLAHLDIRGELETMLREIMKLNPCLRNAHEVFPKNFILLTALCCNKEFLRLVEKYKWVIQHEENSIIFFKDIERLSPGEYAPTVNDLILVRRKTTGLTESKITIHGKKYLIVDQGGARSERKKWNISWNAKSNLIFFVSLIDYNKAMYEDEDCNRMLESLTLFEDIINSEKAKENNVLLLFTMVDLFTEKIRSIDLQEIFPEYTGGKNVTLAKKFIVQKFLEKNKNKINITVHFINTLNYSEVEKTMMLIGSGDNTASFKYSLSDKLYNHLIRARLSDLIII